MTRIQEIRNRVEAATKAPWTEGRDMGLDEFTFYAPSGKAVGEASRPADVTFITNAAADINYLLHQIQLMENEALRREGK